MTSINGKTLEEVSLETGISVFTLRYRQKHMGSDMLLINEDLRHKNKGNYKYYWNGLKGAIPIAMHIGVSSDTLVKYVKLANGSVEDGIALIKARNERLRHPRKRKSQAVQHKLEIPKPSLGLWATALGLSAES